MSFAHNMIRPHPAARTGWIDRDAMGNRVREARSAERARWLALGLDGVGDHELELHVTIEGLPDDTCETVLKAFPGAQRFHLC